MIKMLPDAFLCQAREI